MSMIEQIHHTSLCLSTLRNYFLLVSVCLSNLGGLGGLWFAYYIVGGKLFVSFPAVKQKLWCRWE